MSIRSPISYLSKAELAQELKTARSLSEIAKKYKAGRGTLRKYAELRGLEKEYKKLQQRGVNLRIHKTSSSKERDIAFETNDFAIKEATQNMKKIDNRKTFASPKPIRRVEKEAFPNLSETESEDVELVSRDINAEQEFFDVLREKLGQTQNNQETETTIKTDDFLETLGKALAKGIETLALLIEQRKQ